MWWLTVLAILLSGCAAPAAPDAVEKAADHPAFMTWLNHVDSLAVDPRSKLAVRQLPSLVEALYTLDGDILARQVAEDFEQHHPMLEGGKDALLAISQPDASPRGGGDNLMMGTARMLVDGGLVLIHRRGKLGPLQTVNFDLLQFNDSGRLVEQWSFLQPVEGDFIDNILFSFVVPRQLDLIPAGEIISGDLTDSAWPRLAPAELTPNQATDNRALVERYLALLRSSERNAESLRGVLHENFVAHIPAVSNGRDAWIEVLRTAQRRPSMPQTEMVLAQGDLVWVLSRIPEVRDIDVPELASADLFRVRDEHIAEQWRVVQPSPRFSRNENGLF